MARHRREGRYQAGLTASTVAAGWLIALAIGRLLSVRSNLPHRDVVTLERVRHEGKDQARVIDQALCVAHGARCLDGNPLVVIPYPDLRKKQGGYIMTTRRDFLRGGATAAAGLVFC